MILRAVAAIFGIIEMFYPKAVTEIAMALTTKGDPEYEFKPWVYTLARVEGFVIVVCALFCGRGPGSRRATKA